MFNKLFLRKNAIRHHQEAPLLNERLCYLKYLSENGAPRNTLHKIANHLIIFTEYLNLKNKYIITPTAIIKAAKKWAHRSCKRRSLKHKFIKDEESRFIHHATQWLNMIGRLKCKPRKIHSFQNKISQYIDYMRNERGLAEISIYNRVNFAIRFLCYIKKENITLRKLNILTIDNFLSKIRKVSKCSRYTMHDYARDLRAFIRYAEQSGWCKNGLEKSIKFPRLYKNESLPYSPAWSDVKKLLASTNGNHPKNIRDRAILMLLAIYGLRCCEVKKLTLDNIDWENEIIKLERAKNAKPQQFPLCKAVGNAILRYLKKVRPKNYLIREIFISLNAPYRSLSPSAISTMVMLRWKPLNIKIRHHGAHSLRHACATHLINEGLSIKEISDHLGHQSIDSTQIYTKVDLSSLRKVADFTIGDLL